MGWTARIEEHLFDDAAAEHITLSSEPVEEEIAQDASGNTNRHFTQSNKALDETRNFTIFDERFLAVSVVQPRSPRKQYWFNLAFLDPVPRRFSGVAWRWLYAALALAGITTAAFGLAAGSATPLLEQPWLPFGVLLAVVTLITLLVFLYRTRFTLTFYSVHGKAPLAEMAARIPTRSAVENFVLELQQRIETARTLQWQNKPQFLRDELRMHCRLWEEGVLPDAVYEPSKVRILAEHG